VAKSSDRRVTSGRKALATDILVRIGKLPFEEALVWAEALGLLIEDGQDDGPVVLLSRLVDRVTAERVSRALLGRLGPEDRAFIAAVEDVFRSVAEMPVGELPAWAETGIVDPAGRQVFGKHTLDLDAAERADGIPWPPVTVMTFQVAGVPAGVLLEVGPSGFPHRMFSPQARRIGTALIAAADLADEVNA
jgi:hypothetical protein